MRFLGLAGSAPPAGGELSRSAMGMRLQITYAPQLAPPSPGQSPRHVVRPTAATVLTTWPAAHTPCTGTPDLFTTMTKRRFLRGDTELFPKWPGQRVLSP